MILYWIPNKKTVLKHSAPYPEGSGTRCYCTVFGYRLSIISLNFSVSSTGNSPLPLDTQPRKCHNIPMSRKTALSDKKDPKNSMLKIVAGNFKHASWQQATGNYTHLIKTVSTIQTT
jgi:hypothetical protein